MLTGQVSQRIARPADVVQAHVADVDHHARLHVHAGVTFALPEHTLDGCRYRQASRLGPAMVVQELGLTHQGDGILIQDIVNGAFQGGRICFRAVSEGAQLTRLEATIDVPLPGLKRLAKPLLQGFLRRQRVSALEEDRIDLEAGGD